MASDHQPSTPPTGSPLPADVQDLIADVAHQMNNHLAVVLGRLSLLSQTSQDPAIEPSLAAMTTSVQACHRQMERLAELIDP